MENQQTQQASPQNMQSDIEKNKTMAVIGYIFSFLFFVPLVSEESKNSVYAKFHSNQQLLLLIYWVGCGSVICIVSFLLALTLVLVPLTIILWFVYSIFGIILVVLGAINASKGEMKPLPLIGGINIIK